MSSTPRRPVLLVIADGMGHNPSRLNNAVALANTPNLDRIYASTALSVIEASGRAVGLPPGQMGNSEVGHLTIGAGRILHQDLVRIQDSIDDGSFLTLPALQRAADKARAQNRPLHLLGLVSDGGIHSHINHLLALLAYCKQTQTRPLLHMITDGRDTAPNVAASYLPAVESALAAAGGAIASISGRYYALDRDQRWARIQAAFAAQVHGQGPQATSALAAIESAYAQGTGDEFILPSVLPGHEPIGPDDQVLFFNFRNDRPRELTQALYQADFDAFDRGDYRPAQVTTMTQYDANYGLPVLFAKDALTTTLAQTISDAGIAQFHCAETEKYPHVTFFFNGGKEAALRGESRHVAPSPKVATYDLAPQMSAYEVADSTVAAINSGEYGFIVVNFANGDMVGHCGVLSAAIAAVEVVDEVVGRVFDCAQEAGFSVIITADHGNCDVMVDPLTGGPHTQHTTFPVACAIADPAPLRLVNGAGLSNLAATVLSLMGLPVPSAMDRALLQDCSVLRAE